jgi:hypothetical protein
MRLIGLMPVRNEQAFVAFSSRVALRWCDGLVILDHASKDRTPAILRELKAEYGDRVTLLREESAEWAEMSHRQRTLEAARDMGATHCAIVDADEVLTGDLLNWIRPNVETLDPGELLQIPMRNMWRRLSHYRSDRSPFGSMAITTVAFGMAPQLRWQDANGYPHHHREPYGAGRVFRIYPQQMPGGVMHLQFVQWERLVAKQVLYRMSERVRFPHKPVAEIERMYSLSTDETGIEIAPAGQDWWEPHADIAHHLDFSAPIWQADECRRLMAAHGPETFAGLNLHGVA